MENKIKDSARIELKFNVDDPLYLRIIDHHNKRGGIRQNSIKELIEFALDIKDMDYDLIDGKLVKHIIISIDDDLDE